MVNEIWKDICDYNGIYKISNYGEIRRYNTYCELDNRIPKYHVVKQYVDKNGYCKVILSKNNKQKNHLVHRLVAQAFIPNINNLPQVNHKDENKLNNCIDNLEWCSRSYNCKYGTRTKRIAEKTKITNKGKHFSPKTEFKKGWNKLCKQNCLS